MSNVLKKIDGLGETEKQAIVAKLLLSSEDACSIADAFATPEHVAEYVDLYRWSYETASSTYAYGALLGLVAAVAGNRLSLKEGVHPMSKTVQCKLWVLINAPSSCGKNQSMDPIVLDTLDKLESTTGKALLWTHGSPESLVDTLKSAPMKSVVVYSTEAPSLFRQIIDASRIPSSVMAPQNMCDIYSNSRFNLKYRRATPVMVTDCRVHIVCAQQSVS